MLLGFSAEEYFDENPSLTWWVVTDNTLACRGIPAGSQLGTVPARDVREGDIVVVACPERNTKAIKVWDGKPHPRFLLGRAVRIELRRQ